MREAFIYEAVRTPIGRRRGGLSGVRAEDLAALTLAEVMKRSGAPMEAVEDVVMGCVTQMGEQGSNVARIAALIAGFPVTTTGTTVNRQCGSSLQAMNFVAQAIQSGAHELAIAAGVESMTRVPMGTDFTPPPESLTSLYEIVHQGESAERIAAKWGLSRENLDAFALESHRRALYAQEQGYFEREIVSVQAPQEDDSIATISRDEGPRAGTTLEKLATLKTPFRDDGVVTAASSSQISDGSCAVLLGSAEAGQKYGLKARAKIRSMALAGVDPTIMLTGPIPATAKALERAGLELKDIDLFEVNEAFAPIVLAWQHDTGADLAKTNVNGGACALGHPLGASGVRLVTTLLYEMERRDVRYGLATLCIGFGQAVATIIERDV